jgi:hypothetical protein
MVDQLRRKPIKVSDLTQAINIDHPRSTAYASAIHLNCAGNRSPRRIVFEGDPESRNDQGIDGLL